MREELFDAIVIGGGPAGLSAAQSLGRALRRVLVVDAGSPRNRFAAHMHNVLGFDGAPPSELAERGRAEAEAYGVEFADGVIAEVREASGGEDETAAGPAAAGARLVVRLDDGRELLARALVVATGVADALPEIPGLAERWGDRVLHCPYCHGWEVRGLRLAVIPTSPLGMHQARLVRQWSDRLTVFTAGLGDLAEGDRGALRARGIALEDDPVVGIADAPAVEVADTAERASASGDPGSTVGEGAGEGRGRSIVVRTASGREIEVDAVFSMGRMVPQDAFLDGLGLERADGPMGSVIAVDLFGRTSHPRIWAAGNVVNPPASVPMVVGAGSFAGAAVNAALVEEDFETALAGATDAAGRSGDPEPDPAAEDPAEFWERRYGESERIWSGKVNRALADLAETWAPGRSLDLGCGEGGDAIWLAEHGWVATGIDLSATAVDRARDAAKARGIPEGRARFVAADLAEWDEPGEFDLVTASFLQSPVELPREEILRSAAARVAPGGRLVVVSHAAPPPWARAHAAHRSLFPSPSAELASLELDPDAWEVEVAEVRSREATGPDGERAELEDTVIVARRRSR
ncbi:NAD(P)/FAD-dependent oxidoreductase [Leucobacter sp. CSA1]|uniref:NAD(P)/FAD-dependent oxidoreductase n=1 Tax=Leucobacter chromiisoli TaxID=2796471 RepID=A0A934Q8J4_9MICO|nr:bifunctional NAD(P)/FAD-dependent oxidoreductase/class I SAM-dependent methyltransferase [Leucobacter chromiisoli]MBK0419443.1 NAD(P)/FAD-dependent oxidoreductase [Leucobacter chromiisoli]